MCKPKDGVATTGGVLFSDLEDSRIVKPAPVGLKQTAAEVATLVLQKVRLPTQACFFTVCC